MRKKKSYVHHINYNWTPAPLQPVPLQLVKKKLSKPSEKQERKKRFLNVSSIISEHLLQISASFLLDYAKNNIMVL